MKNYVFSTLIATVFALLLFSCDRNDLKHDTLNDDTSNFVHLKDQSFTVHYAAWDEWGRTSKDCDGWGLCNYVSCWFCCIDENNNIVDCDSFQDIVKSAIITIDTQTNEGTFIIKLNSFYEVQRDAINNESIFYIDDDIENEDFILHSGNYQFNDEIGDEGGYILDITKK
ncbi:MAG: hypothetical protein K9H62_23060 [Bacteroidales bacterium]|nr:hypothetical protein [Bacteroidales bacterium]